MANFPRQEPCYFSVVNISRNIIFLKLVSKLHDDANISINMACVFLVKIFKSIFRYKIFNPPVVPRRFRQTLIRL